MHIFSFLHKLNFENSFCFLPILSCQTSFSVLKIKNCFWKQKIREENNYQTYPKISSILSIFYLPTFLFPQPNGPLMYLLYSIYFKLLIFQNITLFIYLINKILILPFTLYNKVNIIFSQEFKLMRNIILIVF